MGAACCKGRLDQVDVEPAAATTDAETAVQDGQSCDDLQPTPVSFDEDVAVVEARVKCSPKFRRGGKVREVFKFGRTLGTGGFAVVKLVTERKTNKQYACKIMTVPDEDAEVGENESTRLDVFKEIEILCQMEHDNVLHLSEFYEEGNKVYLITELLTGGELLDAVLERGTYSEADACICFSQLLKGIAYLHSKDVTHRDLKLENLLLATPDDITKIKIVDFGLAKRTGPSGGKMATVCGTPQYVAPEIIQSADNVSLYGKAVDMWSAGVVLFILLGGYPPFDHENEPIMFEQIRRGMYEFDDPVWDNISRSAKDLIRRLLTVNPEVRLTPFQCLRHEWFALTPSDRPLSTTTANLKKTYQRQFRKAVNVVLTINKMKRLAGSEEGSGKTMTDSTAIAEDSVVLSQTPQP